MAAWLAELRKLGTVRRQWMAALLAAGAMPLTALLVAATGHLGADETATSGAATGVAAGLLAYGTWAAAIAAGEYTTQTIVVSLTSVPQRARLYAAKIAAAATVAGIGALLSAMLALVVVLAVSPPGNHRVGTPATLLGVALAVAAVAGVGAATGALTRSPAGSIAIIVFALLAPQAAGGLLGGLQPWIVGASPATVVAQLAGSRQVVATDSAYPGGPGLAAVTMVVTASVVIAVGGVVFHRRDG